MTDTATDPATARRMFDLLEPICLVTYMAHESDDALRALGHRTYWDGYFAGRAFPLGRVPAEVVHATFYSFAPGEAARHIPSAWETVPPETSFAAWENGSAASVRRILGSELVASAGLARANALIMKAALAAPTNGRPLFAGWRSLPVPEDPATRLWHGATMLREHRGDGHVAALLTHGVGGAEAHALAALASGIHPATSFGRLHHLPKMYLDSVMDGLRDRGLVDADGYLTDAGTEIKRRVEQVTDELAWPPYAALTPAERGELISCLEPLTARMVASGSR
ncbi:hypothetical protein FHX74_002142 [Friedmanniella endophytica]|uniref:Uncharacterized protein n=1 Tax=Microlunatus kandeliicorticis TaxID=1759536 RepID=A0A7W3ISS5_9ACTN|nr:MarR family transcriptional regulator [Microlunatus kandeliicorticis]MBA8794523.1 hypothetical protein [Microlunatus kandeliicorticis]